MAGGILFGIILIVALIIVGIGTFLISKARMVVQNADFWTNSIAQFITDVSVTIENFFQLQRGTVERWLLDRAVEIRDCVSRSGDGLLTGSLRYLSVAGRAGTFVVTIVLSEIYGFSCSKSRLLAATGAHRKIISQ